MPMPRFIPAILGAVAALATTAILVIHIVLARSLQVLDTNNSVRIAAILSSVLEVLVLILFGWLIASALQPRAAKSPWRVFNNVWFGASLLICVVAAAASVATVVRLSNSTATLPAHILGSTATGFLAGSAVALGISFAMQLVFLVAHYITSRFQDHAEPQFPRTEQLRRSPQPYVKSIPYHQTSPVALKEKARNSTSLDYRSPPGSSGGRSATETMSSIRSSLSHVVRPISSKTRLLPGSQRSSRHRPSSLDSTAWHERSSVPEDGFDSWDTSAVDPHNRQTVLESSSPVPGRFLETIPASPTTSRSPSPGTPLDLEPPKTRRRSRSYSPAGSTRSEQGIQRPTLDTQHASASESHIHPLFRSDSPTPPPMVTPGTTVTAAPNAGQVIADRQSIRTLNRMRSGSLPAVPSPLSRQGSFDDFHGSRRGEKSSTVSPSLSPELREEPEVEEDGSVDTERKMTPPIPDWILSAGSRMSLTGYNSRKLRSADGEVQQS